MKFVITCLIWVWFCPISWATTYYVDSAYGNDSNSGTSSSAPWKTTAKVNGRSFLAGDQILFKRGSTWRETLAPATGGIAGKPIVFGAYGSGNPPMISGANLLTSWLQYSTNVWRAYPASAPSVVIFNGTLGRHVSYYSSLQSLRDWYWSGSALYVYATSSPTSLWTSPGVEAGARNRCISVRKSYLRFQDLAVSGANGYAITTDVNFPLAGDEFRHLTVKNVANTAVQLNAVTNVVVDSNTVAYSATANGICVVSSSYGLSSNVIISNNTVYGIPGMAICTDGDASHLVTLATLKGNVVHGNGDGVYIHYTDNSTISGNVSYSNTLREGTGIGLSGSSYNIVEKNVVYSNGHNGIEMSAGRFSEHRGASNNIVRYNSVHHNRSYGIKSSSSYSTSNQVYYNLVFGHTAPDTCAIHFWSTGHKIYNNTLSNNYNGICLYTDSANVTIKNNIVSRSTNIQVSVPSTSSGIVCDYNDYYPSYVGFIWKGSYMSYSSWKSQSGQDAHSIVADPQLLSSNPSSSPDLRLQSSSPAINHAYNLGTTYQMGLDEQSSNFPAALVNQSLYGAWDIGAYVYHQVLTVVVR
jgi:parallel beta-helix repeat protein